VGLGENLLVRGDALLALRGLLASPAHSACFEHKVDLCYIDPPFNTGEKYEHYADRLDTATWLSLLRDVLMEIRRLLAPEGSIWLHLDDAQQHRARCVLDEVFGEDAFVATVIWQKRTSRDNRKAFSSMHDYIHVYSPAGPLVWKKRRNALPDNGAYSNPDDDPVGPWRSVPMTAQAGHATQDQYYTVRSPAGVAHRPPAGRCWTYTKPRFEELVAAGRVYWPRAGRGKPRLKRYKGESTGLAPFTIWTADEVGENADAKKALLKAAPSATPFDTPKPYALLERIVKIATNPGDRVMDCFLGSGTTAIVAHRLHRRWVGIEKSGATIHNVAMPLLRTVTNEDREGGPGFSVIDVVCESEVETLPLVAPHGVAAPLRVLGGRSRRRRGTATR
jgi:adenine-specific DNA-methyltransferase